MEFLVQFVMRPITESLIVIFQVLKASASFAEPLAPIILAVVAIVGLMTWRREFVGKRRIELAEEVLTLFYEAKDAIADIRTRWLYTTEKVDRPVNEAQTDGGKYARDMYEYRRRFREHAQVFSKLSAKRYRFMALFGAENREPFEKLRVIHNELVIALQTCGYAKERLDRSLHPDNEEELHKDIEECRPTLYRQGRNDQKDEIEQRVDDLIAEIEAICRPIIEKGHSSK